MHKAFIQTIVITGSILLLLSCDDNSVTDVETITQPLLASMETNPDTLIESQEEEGVVSVTTDGPLPEDGVEMTLLISASDGSSKPLARFKIASFNPSADIDGAVLTQQPNLQTLNRLGIRLTAPTATISLTVNDDSFDNGPLDVSFSIQESESFLIEDESGSASFTIIEE